MRAGMPLAAWLLLVTALGLLLGCARKQPAEPTVDLAEAVKQASTLAQRAAPEVAAPEPTEAPVLTPLPGSVLADIRAIVEAQSPEAAVQATRTVLANAGVAVRPRGGVAPPSASGLSVSEAEVVGMAFEAKSRASMSRLNFAELTETLTLVSGLSAPASGKAGSGPAGVTAFDYAAPERQWVAFINDWLAAATMLHNPKDPAATAVTSPVLYLAALAMRQEDPVDLRTPFMASELRLGTLDTVLLLAGLRTALRVAHPEAFPVPIDQGLMESTRASVAPAVFRADADAVFTLAQAPSAECEALKRSLSGNQQAATDTSGWAAGEALESALATALERLGSGGRSWARIVGPLFDVAGIVAKWLSLMELYKSENFTLDVSIDPQSVHKPTSGQVIALTTLKIGIPDEKWRELRRKQADNPVLNLLKGCARSIGLPVPSDLASIGGSIGSWHVEWQVTEGAPTHVVMPGGQFLESGASASRLETQLKATSDHSGEGQLILEVQKEKKEDHPGVEQASTIVVCGKVRTDEPPSIQTYLNSGLAGGTAEALTLVLALSDLLAGMVQNAFTIDACGRGIVTYHVPKNGNWRGTIRSTSDTTSKTYSPQYSYQGRTSQSYRSDTTYIVDEIFVRSADEDPPPGFQESVHLLAARQYTYGSHLMRSLTASVGRGARPSTNRKFLIGCDSTEGNADEAYGNWSFDTDETRATLTLHADGRYEIEVASVVPESEREFTESVEQIEFYQPQRGNDCREAWQQTDNLSGTGQALAATPKTVLRGKLDPTEPGNKITGVKLIYDDDTKIKINWDLTHEGPIRLPGQ